MDLERWWPPFVGVVTPVWTVMFVADVSGGVEVLGVSDSLAGTNRTLLRWLLVVFLLDLVHPYRWSERGPREFLRSNWSLVPTVVPWFRPLRAGSFLNRIQGIGITARLSQAIPCGSGEETDTVRQGIPESPTESE